ncbi:MAG: tripartite tricarboxylate transporter substrate-binding protein, partial [Sulfuricaulis sp.]|nr:tripartite tricarboxylate transporter substrate-binding protein [Sulfuricaulis sp.]
MFVFTAIERIVHGQTAALVLLLCAALAGAAWAQTYPAKPVRFIVGFGAGGGNDMIARTLSRKLTECMGQQVIVDNRPGGAGIVAAVMA